MSPEAVDGLAGLDLAEPLDATAAEFTAELLRAQADILTDLHDEMLDYPDLTVAEVMHALVEFAAKLRLRAAELDPGGEQ